MTQPSFEYLERERVLTDGTNKYPVITPTEQWEREVRGRKDLKEGVEFRFENSGGECGCNKFPYCDCLGIVYPILPVQEEVKGGEEGEAMMLMAKGKYCSPYGNANPETYAYIEGYKDALIIADSNARANQESCELVWFFRRKIKELVENLEAEVSEYRKQSKMRKSTREEKDINAGLIMAKVDAIAILRPLMLNSDQEPERSVASKAK